MAINLKYRPLRAFSLAAETRSFTQAANRLGVSQPSFSALIQHLEATLQLRLFERTTRRLALSAAGEDFLARIERPLAEVEQAYRSALDLAEAKRGTAVIGVLPSAALALVPLALEAVRRAHPALQVRIIEAHNDQLIGMLRTNQLDCALGAMPDRAADLLFEHLLEDRFCAVFQKGHALASAARIDWLDLLPHDLILLSRGSNARTLFDIALIRRSAALAAASPRYDVTNMTTAARLAARGLGVAILPHLALHELEIDGLIARAIDSPLARRRIGVVCRRDGGIAPASQRFVQHLKAILPGAAKLLLPLQDGATGGSLRHRRARPKARPARSHSN